MKSIRTHTTNRATNKVKLHMHPRQYAKRDHVTTVHAYTYVYIVYICAHTYTHTGMHTM